jgi:hypothetical protein
MLVVKPYQPMHPIAVHQLCGVLNRAFDPNRDRS